MDKFYLDLTIVLFFLTALVVVSQTKKQMIQKGRMSFNMIAFGVGCLTLMSLVTLVLNQMVELVSVSMTIVAVVELFRMVLLVSGLVLVTSGVSKWLPSMSNKEDRDESSIMRIGQLRRLGQFLSNSAPLSEFLRETLNVFAENLCLTTGAVFALSTSNETAKLIATVGTLKNSSGVSDKFVVKQSWLKRLSSAKLTYSAISFSKIHPSASGLCYCFPMSSSNGPTFLYLLWTKDVKQAESFDPYILKQLTDSLEARISTERLNLINDFNKMIGEFGQSLKKIIAAQQSVNEMLSTAKSEINKHMPAEFISICMMNGDGTQRRISIGQSETVLNEVQVGHGPHNSYLNQIATTDKGANYKNIGEEKEVTFPELMTVSRIKSLLAIPLKAAAGTNGVLSLGCARSGAYRKVDLEILNRIAPTFEIVLNELVLEKQLEVVQVRGNLLEEFGNQIAVATSATSLYKQAVSTIRKALNCPIVRLSTVDEDGQFLNSQALINEGVSTLLTPERGSLILSQLLWHNTVQKNGSTILVDSESGQLDMPEIETTQVFSGDVKRAAIVPIKHGEKILGMISIADDRKNTRTSITEENIKFVETIAAMTAVAVTTAPRREAVRVDLSVQADRGTNGAVQMRDMRSQLKSSLTSIIGSLELIKGAASEDESKKDRFLAIIDKSARKMNEYLAN